jgi:hypothetical protein
MAIRRARVLGLVAAVVTLAGCEVAPHGTVKDPRARQTIAVSGCGERSTYACWDWVGDQPGRRGRRRHVDVGTSWLEAAGGAPAHSAGSTTPRGQ